MQADERRTVAILGTRGIPNRYGGFEQCAEYLGTGLVEKGYDVIVYNPHWHPYRDERYRGVRIIRRWCPENKLGTAAHFIYDYLCLRDALRRRVEVVLELGYGSVALSYLFCKIEATNVVTNMDGLEWKREKWNPVIRRLMRWFEKIGALKSQSIIADNPGIKEYLRATYGREASYIPYGAAEFKRPCSNVLEEYRVVPGEYYLGIARFELENNLDMILEGYAASSASHPMLLIGNAENACGRELKGRFKGKDVRFLGGIYDTEALNNLRHFATLYFHGHSVGGTNPALLEAMAAGSRIRAHDNAFNRSVADDGALYFRSASDVAHLIEQAAAEEHEDRARANRNLKRIRSVYNWGTVIEQYAALFERVTSAGAPEAAAPDVASVP